MTEELDTRPRVAVSNEVNLAQLDSELGGHGLCGSATEIVVAEGSPITVEELTAAIEAHTPRPAPLNADGVSATLNAVLGVWPLADAANAVRLPEQALVDEANAWAELVAAAE